MAVMTSPALEKVPLEAKATSYSVDPMAVDGGEANGVSQKVDNLLNEPAAPDTQPQPTTNGNHTPTTGNAVSALTPPIQSSGDHETVSSFLPTKPLDSDVAEQTATPAASGSPIPSARSDQNGVSSRPPSVDRLAETAESSEAATTAPATELKLKMESLTEVTTADAMDISPDMQDPPASIPPAAAPSPSINPDHAQLDGPAQPDGNTDLAMPDAPMTGKIRSREDDDEDGAPDAKRSKTGDESTPYTDFKVPEAPKASAPPVGNGVPAAQSAVQTAVGSSVWPDTPIIKPQKVFLMERLKTTKKIKAAEAFKNPVDHVALNIPTYPDIVKKPMDLSTMEKKLQSDRYHSVLDFMRDLDQIIENTLLFNGPEHSVTQAGYNMRAYFLKAMHKLPQDGEEPPSKPSKPSKPKKPTVSTATKPLRREARNSISSATSPPASAVPVASPQAAWPLNSDGMPLIRRDSSSTNDRPKREIHRPAPKELPSHFTKPKKKKYQQELRFCESVMSELLKPKYHRFSFPFLKPVDPVALNIPQYLKIIKKPMDLGTIDKNLRAGQYQTAKDFYADVQLVFANCYKFNPETDEVNKMGHMLEDLFKSLWAEKQTWLAEHAPQSDPQSPVSENEDEEEEDDEEEVDDSVQNQFLEIQKQIAALNETAQALLQKKVKQRSPKAGAKKSGKASKAAKPKKSSLVPPPAKPAAKPKARAKAPAPLSFAQKQEISDGISTLGDADMRKAIQIIRNGCPHLANVNDDEMEIDMDEISDETLRELLKFIRSVKTASKEAVDDDYEPKPGPKSAATAKQKKNKPMGKKEQEESIRKIQEQLRTFDPNASGTSQSPPVYAEESSDDEESGSESEEE